MLSKTNKTWLGTIGLASILMLLAIFGGTWGTSYAASSEASAAPVITSIDPVKMPVSGSGVHMVIRGSNFGTLSGTHVWVLQWGGPAKEMVILSILSDLIVIDVPGSMTNQPNRSDVGVVTGSGSSTVPTIPTIPVRKFTFWVYLPTYLPMLSR
ncbi:MAG: IPT/TIG domain-containing protein [Saprospiraceae bacterium]|nr:IPT/TIG domain-containing protein [Saprospiraceae bacterium]